MQPDIKIYRHPKEGRYGAALTVIGAMIWLLLILSFLIQPRGIVFLIFAVIYGVIAWVLLKFLAALFRAHMFGNMVALTDEQFPELYTVFVEVSQKLGLSEIPQAFIYNSHGVMNALALRLSRGRYVLLTSAIVEAEEDAQLRFVMGHEIAHHVLGHLNSFKEFVRMPAGFVPFLYPAYSRAREYSCDAVGASMVDNKRDAQTALQMIACGAKRLNHRMNPAAFAAQERHVPGFAGFCREILMTHPRMTRRVNRLISLFPEGKEPRA